MFDRIMKAVGPRVGLATLALKQHAPEIYLGAGVGAGVAAAVMLAKAHKESEETFQPISAGIESVHDYVVVNNTEDGSEEDFPFISPADERKMLVPFYIEGGRRAAVLYGPSVIMGIGALALILASHKSLRSRNRALIATVGVLERAFSQYRKRVVSEMGEEADTRFYYGAEARTVTTVTVGKDGKKKKKKESENHISETPDPIMYQRLFDETNRNWSNMDDMSEFFLRSTERYMNDILAIKGWVLLNTAYEALGFEASPEGAVVGWSRNVPGDEFISFGIDHDINMRESDDRYILDFNVSGVILDHIGEK